MEIHKSKICSTCKELKLYSDFYVRTPKNGRYGDGCSCACKVCTLACGQKARNRVGQKDIVKEYNNNYRTHNQEKIQNYYKKSDETKKENVKLRQQKYFDTFVALVEKNEGTCLGTAEDYKTAHSKISVKCADGHVWEISLNNVRKRWCPVCSTYFGELVTLKACEYLFAVRFKKVRPAWLLNNENNRLEIDVYNEELNFGVEYNGMQHYKIVPYFHSTMEQFVQTQAHDKIKITKCKERGTLLLIVPYTIDTKNICQYIADEATKLGLILVNSPSNFSICDLRKSIALTNIIKNIVATNNGTLVAADASDEKTTFTFNNDTVTIKCENQHIWTTKIRNIKNGGWCQACAQIMKVEIKNKISKELIEYYATEEGKKSKKEAQLKRSETMKIAKDEIRKSITEKPCELCKKVKTVDNFAKKTAAKSGYQSYCNACSNVKKREFRTKNKTTQQVFA